jgi:hypothetical protein
VRSEAAAERNSQQTERGTKADGPLGGSRTYPTRSRLLQTVDETSRQPESLARLEYALQTLH